MTERSIKNMIYSKRYITYDILFLKEITELFISNLIDLKEGLARGIKTNDTSLSLNKFYQSKSTLILIGNARLLVIAEELMEIIKNKPLCEIDKLMIHSFQHICNRELKNLTARLTFYENYLVTKSH